MHWLKKLWWRIEVLFLKGRAETELDDELRDHLRREIAANLSKGMGPDEAHRKAHLAFGGMERTKEQVRDVRGARGADDLLMDVRYATRSFLRRPGFTGTAVLLMALGIGATATIFSVVDGVLLRPLPYPDSDRLLYVDEGPHSAPDFKAWQENLTSFEALEARAGADGSLTGTDGPDRVRVSLVSPSFLSLLGGRPLVGRLFAEEDQANGGGVVVLDHGYWVRSWGSDPDVVGRRLRLDGEPVLVVGVLTPDFSPPELVTGAEVDVWTLLDPEEPLFRTRDYRNFGVLGRLGPGLSVEVAQAEMDALASALAEEFPPYFVLEDGSPRLFPLVPLREATIREARSTLLMLLGAVGLLLLIACANVANLFLARGTARAGELSLRGALGASRSRITRQLLTESTLLALVGGLLGIAMAFGGVELFTRLGPADLPRLGEVTVDLRVLAFSLLVSVATGVFCGVFPVFQLMREKGSGTLRDSRVRTTSGRRRRKTRNSLIVAELVLSVVLLTGAGLLFRSLLERMQVEPGFESANRIVAQLQLGDTYSREARTQFVVDLRERLEGLPVVTNAAAAWVAPFVFPPESCCWSSRVRAAEDGVEPGTGDFTFIHPITGGYFESLGVDLAFGREFSDSDHAEDPNVAVVNPLLARRLFGTEDAVGRQLMVAGNGPLKVVGVERGHRHWALDREVDEALYVPYGAWGNWFVLLHVVIEADIPLQSLAPELRRIVNELDPELALSDVQTMDRLISQSLATPRFLSLLFGVFATVAYVLATGGVYATLLYSVGQRRREMGIRLAMGARKGHVTGMVVGEGAILAGVGLGGGVVVALLFSRLLSGLVWGVTVTDPGTYLAVVVALGATTFLASWIPARRAAKADLVETLRAE
jgi:predicted permease